MSGEQKFYGKYRGTVVQNVDPEQLGRLLAIVPDECRARCEQSTKART